MKTIEQIELEASEWVAELAGSKSNIQTHRALQNWLDADPRHQQAYTAMQHSLAALGQDHDFLSALYPVEKLSPEKGRTNRTWRNPAPLAIAAMLLLSIFGAGLYQFFSQAGDVYSTDIAEVRNIRLADGSILTLGAHSEVTVHYSELERKVALNRGEAFFNIMKAPNQPFSVGVGDITVKVLGTRFDVRKGAEETRVAVEDGSVEVAYPLSPANTYETEKNLLTAGKQLVHRQSAAGLQTELSDTHTPGAWRQGRLIYINASLAEIIADINRYYKGQVSLDSEELANLRFTSVFRTNEIDELIETLTVQLPIQMTKAPDGKITLSAAAS